jgi:hypothetical protein
VRSWLAAAALLALSGCAPPPSAPADDFDAFLARPTLCDVDPEHDLCD